MPRTYVQSVINIVIVKCARVALDRTIRDSCVYSRISAGDGKCSNRWRTQKGGVKGSAEKKVLCAISIDQYQCSDDIQKHLDIVLVPAV